MANLFRYILRMRVEDIRESVRAEMRRLGLNPYGLAKANHLPDNAIRAFLDGHEPKLGRMADICAALDWEIYVGPRRTESSSRQGGQADLVREVVQALDRHWDGLENDYARRTWLAHLRRQFPELAGP